MNSALFAIILFICALQRIPTGNAEELSKETETADVYKEWPYPNYIVDPLVPCPYEGVFPHPRNCSWFYRCHSYIVAPNFFHRFYFECEPGTVFSDELDQCVWGSWDKCPDYPGMITSYPKCPTCPVNLRDCHYITGCPDQARKDWKMTILMCEHASYKMESCGHCLPRQSTDDLDKSFRACPNNEWFYPFGNPSTIAEPIIRTNSYGITRRFASHFGGGLCYPSPRSALMTCKSLSSEVYPASEPNCEECFIDMAQCRRHVLCPGNGQRMSLTLCAQAAKICLPCESSADICPAGQYFSFEKSKCFPYPESRAMKCATIPRPTIRPPTTSPPCNDCQISTSHCNNYEVCPGGGKRVSLLLCQKAVRICEPCGSRRRICRSGEYYSMENSRCLPTPESEEMACQTFPPAPPTTESPAPPATESPAPTTTGSPAPPTTESPAPPTTESPVPPTTESPVLPTTESPVPPTTESPVPPTTESPSPPTSEPSVLITTESSTPKTTESSFTVTDEPSSTITAEPSSTMAAETSSTMTGEPSSIMTSEPSSTISTVLSSPTTTESSPSSTTEQLSTMTSEPTSSMPTEPSSPTPSEPTSKTTDLSSTMSTELSSPMTTDSSSLATTEQSASITVEQSTTTTAEPSSPTTTEPLSTMTAEQSSSTTVEPSSTMTAEPSSHMTAEPSSPITTEPSTTITPESSPVTTDPSSTMSTELSSLMATESFSQVTSEQAVTITAEPLPSTTTEPSSSTTVKLSSEPPCDQCYTSTARCQPHEVCPDGINLVSLNLCKKAETVCEPCGKKSSICEPEQYYSMGDLKCYEAPDSSNMKCPADVKEEDRIVCDANNIIPKHQWIKNQYCKTYHLCDAHNKFHEEKELCTHFFICNFNHDEQKWVPIKSRCPDNGEYNIALERCEPIPKHICVP